MEHIEYEERVLINENDYQKIITDIKNMKKPFAASLIENVYLDNASHYINDHKMMLRIRTTNGQEKELTLKMKNPDHSTREINETIKHHPIIDKELNNKFSSFFIFNSYSEVSPVRSSFCGHSCATVLPVFVTPSP